MDLFKKEQILNLYGEWITYYKDVNKDSNSEFEHNEPNRKYYSQLSDFEVETIRRMAMIKLGEAFD